jgi:hypothetical protein
MTKLDLLDVWDAEREAYYAGSLELLDDDKAGDL